MKFIKLFEEFNKSGCEVPEIESLIKKYEKWELGFITSWGGTLYINYHNFAKTGKTQPLSVFKKEMELFLDMKKGSDEWIDFDEWLTDGGPSDGIPLFNKKVLEDIYKKIANKTPAPFDLIIYRTATVEHTGINSYTLIDDDSYHGYGKTIKRAYKIPKGTPLIFANGYADECEIIWSPTKSQLKKFKI